jgi:hypothetical protein
MLLAVSVQALVLSINSASAGGRWPLSSVIGPVAAAFMPHHPDTAVMNAASIICSIDLAS